MAASTFCDAKRPAHAHASERRIRAITSSADTAATVRPSSQQAVDPVAGQLSRTRPDIRGTSSNRRTELRDKCRVVASARRRGTSPTLSRLLGTATPRRGSTARPGDFSASALARPRRSNVAPRRRAHGLFWLPPTKQERGAWTSTFPRLVQTGSEVGVGQGGCCATRATAQCAHQSARIKPGSKQIRDSRNSGKFGCRSATRETPPIGGMRCRPLGGREPIAVKRSIAKCASSDKRGPAPG